MRIHFVYAIGESVEALSRYESAYRGDRRVSPRVQLLRLLKSGEADSLRQAAGMIGYSDRQARRMWRMYREGGLDAVLQTQAWGGHLEERVSPDALTALEAKMEAGEIRTLEETRVYLAESWGIVYQSVQGVWKLLRRHRIKKNEEARGLRL